MAKCSFPPSRRRSDSQRHARTYVYLSFGFTPSWYSSVRFSSIHTTVLSCLAETAYITTITTHQYTTQLSLSVHRRGSLDIHSRRWRHFKKPHPAAGPQHLRFHAITIMRTPVILQQHIEVSTSIFTILPHIVCTFLAPSATIMADEVAVQWTASTLVFCTVHSG